MTLVHLQIKYHICINLVKLKVRQLTFSVKLFPCGHKDSSSVKGISPENDKYLAYIHVPFILNHEYIFQQLKSIINEWWIGDAI